MKMRIIKIKGCKTCNEVLIFLDRTDTDDFVRLVAWHKTKEGNFIQTGEVDYCKTNNDFLMHERLIADFSEISACEFANSMQF